MPMEGGGVKCLSVLDLAATLFTPETPKVFCGLKHFNHPSIAIVMSEFKFLGELSL